MATVRFRRSGHREDSYPAAVRKDKSSRIRIRVNCYGESSRRRYFHCWVPENCRIGPKSTIIIDVLPHDFKSFKVVLLTLRQMPPLEPPDGEGLTPLKFVFKCATTLVENTSSDPVERLLSLRTLGLDTFIKTVNFTLLVDNEVEDTRKGGGLLIFYLRRQEDKIDVIGVEERFIPNLDKEE